MVGSDMVAITLVSTPEDVEILYKQIENVPLERTCWIDCIPTIQQLKDYILASNNVDFFYVLFDGEVVGYFFLEYKGDTTAEIHWGLHHRLNYFFLIIKTVFEKVKEWGIINVIALICADNRVTIKIARRLGFKELCKIEDYHDGKTFYIYNYKNKELKNG